MKQKVLKISLITNGVLLLASILTLYFMPSLNQQALQEKLEAQQERRQSLFGELSESGAELIFLGEDIIAQAHWGEMFGLAVANRGLKGDNLEGLQARIPNLKKYKARKVFLQTGFRDLQAGKSAKALVKSYDQVLKSLKKTLPKAKIYIVNLPPISYEAHDTELKNEDIMVFNGELQKLAEANKLEYVDMFTALLGTKESKEIAESYGIGGDFLSAAGYTRCQALLEQYVNDESDAAILEN